MFIYIYVYIHTYENFCSDTSDAILKYWSIGIPSAGQVCIFEL